MQKAFREGQHIAPGALFELKAVHSTRWDNNSARSSYLAGITIQIQQGSALYNKYCLKQTLVGV